MNNVKLYGLMDASEIVSVRALTDEQAQQAKQSAELYAHGHWEWIELSPIPYTGTQPIIIPPKR